MGTEIERKFLVVGDGWLIARHPNLQATLQMADALGTDLRIHAD